MNLNDIIDKFLLEERSVAVLLSEPQVKALAMAAVGFYCGYSDLKSIPNTEFSDITLQAEVSIAEWALIKPLFLLYVERETALQIEATGMQGVNGYGRNSSEVNTDIARLESEFPTIASCVGAISIGGNSISDEAILAFPYGFDYPIY